MSLLDHRAPQPESRPWYRSRWTGAAVVALVHVVLIGFVMTSMPRTIALIPSPREIFYVFHPPPPRALPRMIPTPTPPSQVRVPVFRYAPTVPPPEATITAPPGANGLQLSLFDCAPENLANLTPDQRERCHSTLTMSSLSGSIPGVVKELSLDAGRWRAAITARNTPVTVPCTHTENIIVNGVTMETKPAAMVDPLCVIAKSLGSDK